MGVYEFWGVTQPVGTHDCASVNNFSFKVNRQMTIGNMFGFFKNFQEKFPALFDKYVYIWYNHNLDTDVFVMTWDVLRRKWFFTI